jgi:hypothetical protein
MLKLELIVKRLEALINECTSETKCDPEISVKHGRYVEAVGAVAEAKQAYKDVAKECEELNAAIIGRKSTNVSRYYELLSAKHRAETAVNDARALANRCWREWDYQTRLDAQKNGGHWVEFYKIIHEMAVLWEETLNEVKNARKPID